MTLPKYNTFGRKLDEKERKQHYAHDKAASALSEYNSGTSDPKRMKQLERTMSRHFGERDMKHIKEHQKPEWGG